MGIHTKWESKFESRFDKNYNPTFDFFTTVHKHEMIALHGDEGTVTRQYVQQITPPCRTCMTTDGLPMVYQRVLHTHYEGHGSTCINQFSDLAFVHTYMVRGKYSTFSVKVALQSEVGLQFGF